MSRFTCYSRISPLALCLERERRAWRCGWALFSLFVALAAGALLCPAPRGFLAPRGQVDFIGIQVERAAEVPAAPAPPAAIPRPRLPSPYVPEPELSCRVELSAPPEIALLPEDGLPEPEAAEPLLALELPEHLPATPAAPASAPAGRGGPTALSTTELIAASYRSAPPPPYPPSLRQRRVQGRVGLRIEVDAAGIPQGVAVSSSSGHAAFDHAACDWVRRHWRFHPARRNGVAVASVVHTRVDFVLR